MTQQANQQNVGIEEEHRDGQKREKYEKPGVVYRGKLEAFALACNPKAQSS